MKQFVKHTGLVVPIDRVNVDTDQIIPKQFLKSLTREGLGRSLFYDWRYLANEKPNPEFALNEPRYRGASIIITRANFGCGSSREHAAWALLDFGVRAVIAPSFADIFANNCTKNGILPVTLTDDEVDEIFRRAAADEGYKVTVDLETETVTDDRGLRMKFEFDPFRRDCMMKGLDDIGLALRHEDSIGAYERARHPQAIMYEAVKGQT